MPDVRRLLGALLIAVALGGGLSYFAVVDHYARTSPRTPQPERGAVITMDDHGARVFLTASQWHVLWALQLGAVAVGAVGGLLVARRGRGG